MPITNASCRIVVYQRLEKLKKKIEQKEIVATNLDLNFSDKHKLKRPHVKPVKNNHDSKLV